MSDRLAGFVTRHNVAVVVVMLALTVVAVAGVANLPLGSQAGGSAEAVSDSEVVQKFDYVEANYPNGSEGGANVTPAAVYVRDEGGNALSKAALLDSLRYQQAVVENDSVSAVLTGGGVTGVANVVARQAAGDRSAGLDAQISALESASESEVRGLVERSLSAGSPALALLPADFEPGSTSAESRRMLFQLEGDGGDGGAPVGPGGGETTATDRAETALYEAALDREDPEYFTLGTPAVQAYQEVQNRNVVSLVIPVALLVILGVLAFSYRDLVDVLVGFFGVVVSVLWMFGILGWLEVSAGLTLIVGPVLIVGLSVDYGLHVFMRYREQREAGAADGEDEGIREPMRRGLGAVAVALALVTLTTGVGFMANVTSDFPSIRNLAIGITLGVTSAFVIFTTLVPALKVTVDGLLERVGLDRRKRPLGKHGFLRRLLSGGVGLARRYAPAVIVLAVVAGAAGGLAWTDLDRQAFEQQTDEVAEWKQDLPGPLGWESAAFLEHQSYVGDRYRQADESSQRQTWVLVEGDVTDPAALAAVADGVADAEDREPVFAQEGRATVRSPISVMRSVAESDDAFAETFAAADTDGDGVPDRNVAGVYDALYEAAPDRAAQVVERTDGEYRSLRLTVPIHGSATFDEQATAAEGVAATVEGDGSVVTAIGVGTATFTEAEAAATADSILRTLVVALVAVFVILTIVYRIVEGSATLGAVTALPVALVTMLVVGGMWLLDVPLTLLTALLMSLVVGLGIDYNIHVSDRFARELRAGRDVTDALTEAVTGTGGALLGSTLTSTGAFSALLLHPHPQFRNFGTLVVLALGLAFVVAVFVLPSVLVVWARYVHEAGEGLGAAEADAAAQD